MNVQGTGIAASVRTTGERSSRDLRVDLVRGVALLIIFSDHVIGNPVRDFMPISLGFSDMAEVFLFLSGYVNGIRRTSPLIRPDGRLLLHRGEGKLRQLLRLYGVLLLMHVLTVMLLTIANALGAQSVSLSQLMLPRSSAEPTLWQVMTRLATAVCAGDSVRQGRPALQSLDSAEPAGNFRGGDRSGNGVSHQGGLVDAAGGDRIGQRHPGTSAAASFLLCSDCRTYAASREHSLSYERAVAPNHFMWSTFSGHLLYRRIAGDDWNVVVDKVWIRDSLDGGREYIRLDLMSAGCIRRRILSSTPSICCRAKPLRQVSKHSRTAACVHVRRNCEHLRNRGTCCGGRGFRCRSTRNRSGIFTKDVGG